MGAEAVSESTREETPCEERRPIKRIEDLLTPEDRMRMRRDLAHIAEQRLRASDWAATRIVGGEPS